MTTASRSPFSVTHGYLARIERCRRRTLPFRARNERSLDNHHEDFMIKRLVFAVSAIALTMTVASNAGAQAHVGFSAGLSAPTSTFSDVVKSGYNATLMLQYAVPLSPVGVRGEVGYNRFDFKQGGGNSQVLDGAVNLVLSMPTPSTMKPYVTGGLGAYRHRMEFGSLSPIFGTSSATQTKLGFNGGLGLAIGLTGFQTQLEARYVYITAESGGDPVKYIPISVGVMF
jgi:opacity protein-like surface antigen